MTIAGPQDVRFLARAVALAGQVAGTTSPNPNVGCVIVRDGRIVGEGATRPAGGPHAEVVALERAGGAARGANVYVTLEPCAHQGRTPPCVDALVRAGVARVVIAHEDPHAVAAGGAARLGQAGIEVHRSGDDSMLRHVVAGQLEGFLSVVRRGRPHVTLKLAQTSDGSLRSPGPERWITGVAARRAVHGWRAASDGVLVGSGTVLADDPRLDARHVATTTQPRPVVFDARLRTPPAALVVQRAGLIVTRPDAPSHARAALTDAGAQVIDAEPGVTGGLVPDSALHRVAEQGINVVFAEPGERLARALVEAGVVDRLVLHVALRLGTGRPRRVLPDRAHGTWSTERSGGAGEDLIVHLVPTTMTGDGPSPLDAGGC